MKINGIPISLFRHNMFNPISFISSNADNLALIKCYIDFETVLGRNGLYVYVKDKKYIRFRYSIVSIDGDSVAQFKLAGSNSNTSNCPCLMNCYKKRYNHKISQLCPVNSHISPSKECTSVIPITIQAGNGDGILSLCNSIAMMMKFGDESIRDRIIDIVGNRDLIMQVNTEKLMSIIDVLGLSRVFMWMPTFINEDYNTLAFYDDLKEALQFITDDRLKKLMKKRNVNINTVRYKNVHDHRSICEGNNTKENCSKVLLGFDGMLKDKKKEAIYPVSNIYGCSGYSYVIDCCHLFSLFLDWSCDVVVKLTDSNTNYDEFYKDLLEVYFDNDDLLKTIKKQTFFDSSILLNAQKRITDILTINGNKLKWLHPNILDESNCEKRRISSFQNQNLPYMKLTSYQKMIFLLCLFESIFIDSLYHPIIMSIVMIIRCMSYLYCFHNTKIANIHLTDTRLRFHLSNLSSIVPPALLTPTIHRISHLATSLLASGSLKNHDNLRSEAQNAVCKKMVSNLNNSAVTTVNNRVICYTYCKLHEDIKDHVNVKEFNSINDENNELSQLLSSLPLESIILHCYLDDLLFKNTGDPAKTTIIDLIPSFGIDYSDSENQNILNESLLQKLQCIELERQDFTVNIEKHHYKTIKITTSGKTDIKYYISMNDDVIKQKYLNIPSLDQPIISSNNNISDGIGYLLNRDDSICCYVIDRYIMAKVNGKKYPIAIGYPLREEYIFPQKSKHHTTIAKEFSTERIALISLNRLVVNKSLLSPSIKQDCCELSLLKLYLNQFNSTILVSMPESQPLHNLRPRQKENDNQQLSEEAKRIINEKNKQIDQLNRLLLKREREIEELKKRIDQLS